MLAEGIIARSGAAVATLRGAADGDAPRRALCYNMKTSMVVGGKERFMNDSRKKGLRRAKSEPESESGQVSRWASIPG